MSLRRLLMLSLVAGVLAGLASALVVGGPAHAGSATVVTFDDLGVPPSGRVTLNSQYSGQGVTFNDVSAIDYSQPPFPAGFAHSGTVGIEQCFAVEFCSAPITASFTTGQSRVKVWIGYSYSLAQPLTVRMTAFDAGHASVGSAEVTLPANPAVTPIAAPLEVDRGAPTIRSVEISVPGGFTSGVAVDDLEFTAAGPPPPCDATRVPGVRVTQPAADVTVQHNEFVLAGTVDTGGAPIQSALIVNDARQGNRKAALYPSLIRADGGAFGPVRFNGLLFPDVNKIVVTATNCLGTGTSDEFLVTWTPIPPEARFRLLGLEVSQAVQSASNTVPLVAATATLHKRTFVRVYLGVSGVNRISNVTGTLTASRPDGSLPGGPPSVPSLNSVTVESTTTLASARSSLQTSLNFELPPEWLAPGQLHLELDRLEIEGAQSQLPCIGCDNPGPPPPLGSGGPAFVRFHAVPPLRIFLVGVPYRTGPQTVVSPRQHDFDMLASWLRRAYPSAEVQITQTSLAALAAPPASCEDINETLGQFRAMQQAAQQTRFYGLFREWGSGDDFVRGCAEIGGRVGSGPAGSRWNPWDVADGSYADWYGGHEIAHMYGRLHPGYCGEPGNQEGDHDDPDYPYLGGVIGTAIFDMQGLDSGENALSLPLRLYDWRAGWSDVMTYCDNLWISDHTYRGILKRLCEEDRANCPDHAQFGARARPETAPQGRSRGLAVSVTGTLALATDRVTLDPLWARRGLTLTQPTPYGDYAIVLRGAGGRVLARHRFEPPELSDAPSPAKAKALIREVVPFPRQTKQILITHGEKTLAAVAVSARAPKVRLLSPNGGKALGERVTVRWKASDPDRNRRFYTVLYLPGNGAVIPVAAGLTRTSLRVDLTTLPGSARARFEVVASDGVRTGSDRSDRTFRVPFKPPRASVAAPVEGTEVSEEDRLTFLGAASDLQDGQLSGSQLRWTSSLQGALGTGAAITRQLQPGSHVITLTATNSAGLSSTATVAVTVAQVPPVVVAELVP